MTNEAAANGDDIRSYDTVLTPQSFDLLATELRVQWPNWYRVLVLALLQRSRPHGDWLPGGFLFARPWLIYRDTEDYRTGGLKLFREAASANALEPMPWAPSFVIVGHHGDGSIVLDAADDRQMLYDIYKETYSLRPFLNVQEVAESPQAFAAILHAADEQRANRRRK